MFWSEYLLFCLGAAALIASPGPDFFYVSSRALAQGRAAGVLSALGIGAGLLVHTVLAASGLTLLLFASDALFTALKWAGALYLLWMGVSMLRAKTALFESGETPKISGGALFRQGVLTNILNPKVALTFTAFLTQFVHPQRGGAQLQIAVLGLTLCVLATLWFCFIGLSAGQIGVKLRAKPQVARALQMVSGFTLCALGVRLALLKS